MAFVATEPTDDNPEEITADDSDNESDGVVWGMDIAHLQSEISTNMIRNNVIAIISQAYPNISTSHNCIKILHSDSTFFQNKAYKCL